MQADLVDAAKTYLSHGLSVIPTKPGEKRPIGNWKQYQDRLPTVEEWRDWGNGNSDRFGVLTGKVSGGLEVLDFDDNSHLGPEYSAQVFYDAWRAKVGDLLAVYDLPIERSEGNGLHVHWKRDNPAGNLKLAYVPDETQDSGRAIVIETRGEGGFCVTAPSAGYEAIHGGIIDAPMIPDAVAEVLLQAARDLCQAPYTRQEMKAAKQEKEQQRNQVGDSVIDKYNEQHRVADLLHAHGYTQRGNRFVRPNGKSPSVVYDANSNVTFHWSSNDPLHRTNTGGKPLPIDPFDAYCHFEHNGDVRAAVKAAATLLGMDGQSVGTEQKPESVLGNTEDENFLLYAGKHDEGNAQATYRLYGGRLVFCDAFGWMYYDKTHWSAKRGEARARDAVVSTLKQRSHAAIEAEDMTLLTAAKPSARRVKDALYLFQRLVTVDSSEFDKETHLLNCANGVWDLRTGDRMAHDPSNRFSYYINTPYEPGAWDEGLYHKLMFEWFDGDIEKVEYVQRALGYSLTGDTREECMFYLHGPGRSGKGTMINTPMEMIGYPLAQGAEFSIFTNRYGDPQNFRIAPFWNARVIAASESKKGESLDVQANKMLTGRDTIQVAFKHKTSFSLLPRFKIWLMSNNLPKGDTDDDAFWWRVRLIRMHKSYMEAPDLTLKQQLMTPTERKAMLSWLVYGAQSWYRRNLGRPAWMVEDIRQVRAELDPLQRFVDDALVAMPGEDADLDPVYVAYCEWCEDEGIQERYRLAKNTVSRRLGQKGYDVKRTSKREDGKTHNIRLVQNTRLEW